MSALVRPGVGDRARRRLVVQLERATSCRPVRSRTARPRRSRLAVVLTAVSIRCACRIRRTSGPRRWSPGSCPSRRRRSRGGRASRCPCSRAPQIARTVPWIASGGRRRDRLGGPRGALHQLAGGRDLGDHPDLVRPLRRHPLVVAEQREPHDLGERHDPRHVDRLVRRGHPVGDVRVEERRVLRRDDELDLAEHVERAAARHAVDRRDDRLPEVVRLRPDVVARVVEHERRRARADDVVVGGGRRSSPPICSMRSMPVQKAFSPAPVSTTQRTSSWRRSPRQSACSSRCISELNALCRSGRFSVTYATPLRSS